MRGGDDRGYDSGIPDAPICKEEDLDDKSRDASPMLPRQKVIRLRLFCIWTDGRLEGQTDRQQYLTYKSNTLHIRAGLKNYFFIFIKNMNSDTFNLINFAF